jgi:leucyl-tRNA synthetase
MTEAFTSEGIMVNSGEFDGLKSSDAKEKIADYLKEGHWREDGEFQAS